MALICQATGWCGVAAALLWLAMSFTYPFGWDQGIFAWVGGVVAGGGLPYRDAWDMKGPLAYLIYAALELLFGRHLWTVRLFDAATLLLTTMAVLKVATAFTDRATGRWAALVFFLAYAAHSFWHTAQPDGWAGMLMFVAFAPTLRLTTPASTPWMFLVGLAIGIATLFKPTYAAFLVLPLLHVAATRPGRPVAIGLAVAMGWLVPVAMIAGWFALVGALGDLVAVHLRYASLYAQQSPADPLRGLVTYLFGARIVAVALPVVVFGWFTLLGRNRPAALTLGMWSVLVLFSVALQGRFFEYHWIPLVPVMVLLGAVGLHALRTHAAFLVQATCVIVLLHALAPIVAEEIRLLGWMTGRLDRASYYDRFGEPGDDMRAVEWFRREGDDGEVLVFGWNSGVPWLAGLGTVSRFGFSLPLLLDAAPQRDEYRRELVDILRAKPPRYILEGTVSAEIMGQPMSLADFPELAAIVAEEYRPAVRIGRIVIHAREARQDNP